MALGPQGHPTPEQVFYETNGPSATHPGAVSGAILQHTLPRFVLCDADHSGGTGGLMQGVRLATRLWRAFNAGAPGFDTHMHFL